MKHRACGARQDSCYNASGQGHLGDPRVGEKGVREVCGVGEEMGGCAGDCQGEGQPKAEFQTGQCETGGNGAVEKERGGKEECGERKEQEEKSECKRERRSGGSPC